NKLLENPRADHPAKSRIGRHYGRNINTDRNTPKPHRGDIMVEISIQLETHQSRIAAILW
ncbi:MAG: hypothetical protein ACOC0C_05870, partial [Bacteroidota bacterium]